MPTSWSMPWAGARRLPACFCKRDCARPMRRSKTSGSATTAATSAPRTVAHRFPRLACPRSCRLAVSSCSAFPATRAPGRSPWWPSTRTASCSASAILGAGRRPSGRSPEQRTGSTASRSRTASSPSRASRTVTAASSSPDARWQAASSPSATPGRAPTRPSGAAPRSRSCTRSCCVACCERSGPMPPSSSRRRSTRRPPASCTRGSPGPVTVTAFAARRSAPSSAPPRRRRPTTADDAWALEGALAAAARYDTDCFRALVRARAVLQPLEEASATPGLRERAFELAGSMSSAPSPWPSRERLVALAND